MSSTLNLFEFLEKFLSEENPDLEQKVYILQMYSSKIRKEFFKNNFMPFLKDMYYIIGEIDKILATRTIHFYGHTPRMIDVTDTETTELLLTAKLIFKDLLIEGNKRWHILLDSIEFNPDTRTGTIKIEMPSNSVGLFFNFDIIDNKKIILLKDIGLDSIKEWTWEITWEYDIPKETIKHVLKEKIISLV